MKLEWIDDLTAIAEAKSLTEAAARRHVTQPAFTRRIRVIEEYLGVPLLDRTRRPARPTSALLERVEEFRQLATHLRRVSDEIAAAAQGQSHVALACQHSLAISTVPRLAPRIRATTPTVALRLRTGNRDLCYSMLMTGRASLMVAYDVPGLPIAPDDSLVEKRTIFKERLCPVASPEGPGGSRIPAGDGDLPLVAYPDDSFLGQVMSRGIYPQIPARLRCSRTCESALTPAILALALSGLGVAWVPRLLAAPYFEEGRLIDLTEQLGDCAMDVTVLRLKTARTRVEEDVWQTVSNSTLE